MQERADVYDGLMALPGATLIHAGAVQPPPPALPEPKPERRTKAREARHTVCIG